MDATHLRRGATRLLLCAALLAGAAVAADRAPDVPYQPTPDDVVEVMLQVAEVERNDVVIDLGCGDGRIVIEAARRRGARGIGIDLDAQRIAEANDNARRAGVTTRVRFLREDLFASDLRDATVVMLFLWPEVNLKLRPKLLAELRPGTRIVSHMHDMGDWRPERTIEVGERVVYLWRVPARSR